MAPRFKLACLLLTAAGASGFQPPTSRLVRAADVMSISCPPFASSIVMPLSIEHEDEKKSLFARSLNKLRKPKKPVVMMDSEAADSDSEAATLKALSEKMRLEADKMDVLLTLAKIDKLEQKVGNKDEHPNILRDAQLLMKKITPLNQVTQNAALTHEKETTETSSSSDLASSEKESDPSDNKQISRKTIVEGTMLDGKPPLSAEKRGDVINAFDNLAQPIKDMMAKTVGMKDGSNATAAIDLLMAENRLYEGDDEEKISMIAKTDDWEDIFVDLDFVEINNYLRNMLPKSTRKEAVKEEYIDALNQVFGKDTFAPEEKPREIPGGYLIKGVSKVRPKEGENYGDNLIQALDRRISKSSVLAGEIQVHYIRDPTPPSGEEIMNGEDESPVLLVTGYDISPDTPTWMKISITLLGLASTAAFALVSTSLNPAFQQTLASTTPEAIDSLCDISLTLALSLAMIQLSHDAGHLLISVKDGIQIGFPTFVPSFQLGLSGTITPIKTSPKNIKSLFDFAITGPLFGFAASLILLYSGLEMTVFMEPSAQVQLPCVPVELLRSSSLGGGIIESFLGGVLNSPGGSVINLHPYAIAGFAGLMTNALSLVPIGNTDGGRISVAFFGRSFSRVLQVVAVVILVMANFFGADPSNILLCYAGYSQTFQSEPEVPCRNEIDELDLVRGFIAIGMSTIVILTLVPMSPI